MAVRETLNTARRCFSTQRSGRGRSWGSSGSTGRRPRCTPACRATRTAASGAAPCRGTRTASSWPPASSLRSSKLGAMELQATAVHMGGEIVAIGRVSCLGFHADFLFDPRDTRLRSTSRLSQRRRAARPLELPAVERTMRPTASSICDAPGAPTRPPQEPRESTLRRTTPLPSRNRVAHPKHHRPTKSANSPASAQQPFRTDSAAAEEEPDVPEPTALTQRIECSTP